MALDLAMVRRIAALARIRLEADAGQRVQAELSTILGWIDQLKAVDVTGVAPMAGGASVAALSLRDDRVTEGGQAALVLANAPDRHGAYFAVPKVME